MRLLLLYEYVMGVGESGNPIDRGLGRLGYGAGGAVGGSTLCDKKQT